MVDSRSSALIWASTGTVTKSGYNIIYTAGGTAADSHDTLRRARRRRARPTWWRPPASPKTTGTRYFGTSEGADGISGHGCDDGDYHRGCSDAGVRRAIK